MKRISLIFLILASIVAMPLTAGGDKEAQSTEKVIRVADQAANLITPGVWGGQALSMNSSIYEYFVDINAETGKLDPVLATEWSTEDGTTWTFKLRKGVTFHDGSNFTSADAKYSIERTQDLSIGHLKREDFSIVELIETPDEHTIIVHLTESRPTFVYQFTDYNMAMLSSEYDYAKLGESNPMGTGPFILSQYIPRESAILEKNPSYWNPELPKVDKLIIYFVADIEASISMLEDGRVDVVPDINSISIRRLTNRDGISVYSPSLEHRFVAMNVDEKPWDDNRVRLAFKYSIDPQILVKSVTQLDLGQGTEYNETPILNMQAEYKERPLRGRNLEKSKALLAQAGYPNGVKVELYYALDHPFQKELAQALKELSAPAGFDLDLKGFPRNIYLSQYWLKVPMSITAWGGRADPSMLLTLVFRGGGVWNETHMDNPRVNTLIDQIRSTINEEKKLEYYHELQEVFYEEGAILNVQVPYLVGISDRIIDYRQPMAMLPQYKYTDILP
ncbi:MAG: ABC transporter substrate-binding protein [Sphaerochaetaceae bacterium]|nr:ABC transporter substrate-binding protein [Sphaerochaetaceae bacterium]